VWWSRWKLPHHLFLFPPPPSTSSPHHHFVEAMANTHFGASHASWHHHHHLNRNCHCVTHPLNMSQLHHSSRRLSLCPSPHWGMWAFAAPATLSRQNNNWYVINLGFTGLVQNRGGVYSSRSIIISNRSIPLIFKYMGSRANRYKI